MGNYPFDDPRFATKCSTPEACLERIASVLWAKGEFCPYCDGHDKIYHFQDGRRHKCKACGRVLRISTGTIFSGSPIQILPKFLAIDLDTCQSKGISSLPLAQQIGVQQQTAWSRLQRMRHASPGPKPANCWGEVEVDETYIGGKEKNKHASQRTPGTQGRSTRAKSVAFGIKQRGGKVIAFHVQEARPLTSCRACSTMWPWAPASMPTN